MRTNFYIHIGVPKTGSKSIQNALSENRDKLLEHGIGLFPGPPNLSYVLGSLLSDEPHKRFRNIRRRVDTREKAQTLNESTRYEISKALEHNRSAKVVLSGEGLSNLSDTKIGRLKQILAPYAEGYRIIVYVRDPYQYANSASLQRIKAGGVFGPDWKVPLPHYRWRIEKYIRAFGRENVDIRIFDPQRFTGGDLIADFISALDEDPALTKTLKLTRLNESICYEAALILSETNRAIIEATGGRPNGARAYGFHLYFTGIKGEKFIIDPNAYLKRKAEIAADIAWLNETIGEPAFTAVAPQSSASPRWSEATVASVRSVVRSMVAEFDQLHTALPLVCLPALPAELAWLADAYRQGPNTLAEAACPKFDQAGVRTLGVFMHAVAAAIQHARAERSTRRSRFLLWRNPREAERRYREVARLNPASAEAQFRLSQAHLLRGHLDEAQNAAAAAAGLAPGRRMFRVWLKLVSAARQIRRSPLLG